MTVQAMGFKYYVAAGAVSYFHCVEEEITAENICHKGPAFDAVVALDVEHNGDLTRLSSLDLCPHCANKIQGEEKQKEVVGMILVAQQRYVIAKECRYRLLLVEEEARERYPIKRSHVAGRDKGKFNQFLLSLQQNYFEYCLAVHSHFCKEMFAGHTCEQVELLRSAAMGVALRHALSYSTIDWSPKSRPEGYKHGETSFKALFSTFEDPTEDIVSELKRKDETVRVHAGDRYPFRVHKISSPQTFAFQFDDSDEQLEVTGSPADLIVESRFGRIFLDICRPGVFDPDAEAKTRLQALILGYGNGVLQEEKSAWKKNLLSLACPWMLLSTSWGAGSLGFCRTSPKKLIMCDVAVTVEELFNSIVYMLTQPKPVVTYTLAVKGPTIFPAGVIDFMSKVTKMKVLYGKPKPVPVNKMTRTKAESMALIEEVVFNNVLGKLLSQTKTQVAELL